MSVETFAPAIRVHVREYPHRDPIGYDIMPSGCWVWFGAQSGDVKGGRGYGVVSMGTTTARAHRYVYEHLHGPIPEGLTLDHLCRNKLCVNPEHLEPVTTRENILRGEAPPAMNARKTHCKYGHPLSGDNLIVWHRMRNCRICRKRIGAEAEARRMADPIRAAARREYHRLRQRRLRGLAA